MLRRATIAAIIFSLFSSCLSIADSLPPLTQESIEQFLQSMDDVQKLGKKYRDDAKAVNASTGRPSGMAMSNEQQLARAAAPISSALAEMRKSEGFGEMVATVKRHGFGDVEEWAKLGDRALRAYAAIRLEADMPKINAQMEQMRENLERSGMPAARQETMLKLMQPGAELMKQFEQIPAEDKRAVEPYMVQFRKLAESPR